MIVFEFKTSLPKMTKMLNILYNIINKSDISCHKVEAEKYIVLNEMGRDNDNPRDRIIDYLDILNFKDTPYEYPIVGSRTSIDKIERHHIMAFLNHFFKPDNMILLMNCNMNKLNLKNINEQIINIFEHKNTDYYTIPKIFKYYPEYKKQLDIYQKHKDRCDIIKFHKPHMEIKSVIKKGLNQAFVVISYRTSGVLKCNYLYEEILKYYLTNGLTSSIYDQLRVKNGLIYYVGITNYKFVDIGTFNIQFDMKNNPDHIKFAIQLVLLELEKIKKMDDSQFNSLLKKVKTKVTGITKKTKFYDLLYLSYANKQQRQKYLESRYYDKKYKSVHSISKRNFINYFDTVFQRENLKIIIYSSKKINISL